MTRYKIIQADIGQHKCDILSLLRRNLRDETEGAFAWRYEQTPYGPAEAFVAVEDASHRIVGIGSVFPRRVYVCGEPVTAWIAGDFSVDSAHRAFGPAMQLQRHISGHIRAKGLKHFAYGIPNDQSKAIFRRLGYVPVGSFNRFVKILKWEYRKGKQLLGLRLPVGPADSLLKHLSTETWCRRPRGLSLETPSTFDERFDRLWNTCCYAYAVVADRSAKALAWRYLSCPSRAYEIAALTNGRENLVAYVVYHLEDNMCHVADLLWDNNEISPDCLLAEFSLFMRNKGVGSIDIRYLGNPNFVEHLKRFNFHDHREAAAEVMIFAGRDIPVMQQVLTRDNWHFFAGDTDH